LAIQGIHAPLMALVLTLWAVALEQTAARDRAAYAEWARHCRVLRLFEFCCRRSRFWVEKGAFSFDGWVGCNAAALALGRVSVMRDARKAVNISIDIVIEHRADLHPDAMAVCCVGSTGAVHQPAGEHPVSVSTARADLLFVHAVSTCRNTFRILPIRRVDPR